MALTRRTSWLVALFMTAAWVPASQAQLMFDDSFEDPSVPRADAVRFLNHATFGPIDSHIGAISTGGFDRWITEQMRLSPTLHRPQVEAYLPEVGQGDRQRVWWDLSLNANDQLRQRVAFALSEILVVSDRNGNLEGQPVAVAEYYDILLRNAFGNYRELLEEVTLSPVMGVYLSMLRSTRNPNSGVEPDENYAREIMQLFSIGLVELNNDGSERTSNGQPIPTYTQPQIIALAEAFTGWNFADTAGLDGDCQPWEWEYPPVNGLLPMEPCTITDPNPGQPDDYHVTSAKTIVGNVTLPAGQTAEQDLAMALDTLFNHANVGPFFVRRLIQRLVTSNPTPAYVDRIADVFNNNGQGERGDLGAVVRAILTDVEALNLNNEAPSYAGKLREPLLRVTHLYRALGVTENVSCYNDDNCWPGAVYAPEYFFGQAALRSPSVFNFFKPGYAQPGAIADAGLVSPEFQLATESQVLMMSNFFYDTFVAAHYAPPQYHWGTPYQIRIDELMPLAGNAAQLVDRISDILLGETLDSNVRQIIIDRVNLIPDWYTDKPWLAHARTEQENWGYAPGTTFDEAVANRQVTEAIYFVITSPQYLIER